MYLAGDIGGTNTRLAWVAMVGGVFEVQRAAVYPSTCAPGLEPLLERFLAENPAPLDGAGFGIAGPITGRVVRTTNLPWEIDQDRLESRLGTRVALVNDLVAAAHGTLVMPDDAWIVLQDGPERPANRVVIAAGTGLGEGLLFHQFDTWWPSPSEGGHASFAPRDEEEIDLLRFALRRFEHVSYERLCSGAGLVLIYEFYRERLGAAAAADVRTPGADPAAAIAAAASHDACAGAALRRFVRIYGCEAGNLALKGLATGGVEIAGGIAPKILDAMREGEFLRGFLDKGRYREMLSGVRVRLVLDDVLGLRGAARAASLPD